MRCSRRTEFDDPDYLKNGPDRCYFCKSELYAKIAPLARRLGLATIVNGANLDDMGDYRPGMTAAAEHFVRSPLVECGFEKSEVRALAAAWELPIWDKPAMPCLSSRIAYGEAGHSRAAGDDRPGGAIPPRGRAPRTASPLSQRRFGPDRSSAPTAIAALCQDPLRGQVVAELKRLGFKYLDARFGGLPFGEPESRADSGRHSRIGRRRADSLQAAGNRLPGTRSARGHKPRL